MNEQDTDARRPARRPGGQPAPARTAVRLDQGHVQGTAASPSASTNPGLPRARPPRWPTSTRPPPSGPRSRWRRCSASPSLGTLVFIVAYFAIDHRAARLRPGHRRAPALSNVVLGLTLASRPARHRPRRRPLGQDPDARRRRSSRSATRCASTDEARDGRRPHVLDGGRRPPQLDRAPPDQVHPRRRPRPVRPAARPAGRRQPRPDCPRGACATFWNDPCGPSEGPARAALDARPRAHPDQGRRTSPSARSSTCCPSPLKDVEHARPRGEGQGGGHPHPPRPRASSRSPEAARLGLRRASSPTPRSAPTSAARSASTSSRRTTCCARATSRPST